MDKIFKIIILVSFISSFVCCKGQNCEILDDNFESYKVAIQTLKSTKFNFSEKLNTSKSSWIYDAEYYSCDGENGFLLITTKTKTYIHRNVPIKIWNEFKKAESFGSFYSGNIKSRYQLIL